MRFQTLLNVFFLPVILCAALTAASVHGDTLYVVSSANGSIGTYSSLTGGVINSSLVTGITTPEAIAFDPDLNFYVTGFTAEYVAKYANDGTLINPTYLSPSDFSQPSGITVNGTGEIFVVNNAIFGGDTSVSKFAASGTAIGTPFVLTPGSPAGAMVEPSGDLYVVRWAESAVGKYTSSGSSGTIINASFLTTGGEIDTWRPFNVARDSVGNFYVTGNGPFTDESMVSKFAPDGTLIDARLISFDGQQQAYGLAIDSDDNIFVGSYAGSTIGKYRPDGSTVSAAFITGLPGVTSISIQPVPEPSTLGAVGAGVALAGWAVLRRGAGRRSAANAEG